MSGRRRVSIFGATGSIGVNTVDLLTRQGGAQAYEVVALTGAGNIALLAEQARALKAQVAVTADPARLDDLRAALAGSGVEAAAGPQALIAAAERPADWVMSAIVGSAGLAPGLAAARNGGTLALANKESLVCAGQLLIETCRAHGTRLLPVDSEHSAIFQALQGEDRGGIERLLLTASGGPFRTRSRDEMAAMTPAQAMAHPNWSMGVRISIDSATMFNKALEMIEAQVLFGVTPDQIEVVVHPQSIIHSMIGFRDGAIIAQMGPADMRGAIGFALNWPERRPLPVDRLDFAALSRLDFEAEDPVRFPALRLAREVMAAGGLAGAVFNAAKEAALDAFLAGRIGFLDMAALVEAALDALGPEAAAAREGISLDDVMGYDRRTRRFGEDWVARQG
ncbi:1-deoxy-D-xylulose-5-phosphate reductoisomerase [Halovulum dunhuangense]|uniref:1-deoxy-D-xylulose 5-phosphate reductoisomerase n=1 Tax=Halovulum dunhuangense TaxID=1505036 RepID=A0A849L3H0_9RHOB|nr:1-deoxy-D-xylulose-5-phosphate reductoisomerase [Halovulum dunhuangense]NNU80711.1 1-deoxy-D-xylulose-5-phosphate reductoisomerase [Halovulum dunhuangense]